MVFVRKDKTGASGVFQFNGSVSSSSLLLQNWISIIFRTWFA